MARPRIYSITVTLKGKLLYKRWNAMIGRCERPSQKLFANYGGRGIKVCERWKSFENFCTDMAESFDSELQLDRINNDGNYELSNCRWATRKEQMNNRSNSKIIEIDGVAKTLAQWCDSVNIKSSTVRQRFYGYRWDIKKSLEIGG